MKQLYYNYYGDNNGFQTWPIHKINGWDNSCKQIEANGSNDYRSCMILTHPVSFHSLRHKETRHNNGKLVAFWVDWGNHHWFNKFIVVCLLHCILVPSNFYHFNGLTVSSSWTKHILTIMQMTQWCYLVDIIWFTWCHSCTRSSIPLLSLKLIYPHV